MRQSRRIKLVGSLQPFEGILLHRFVQPEAGVHVGAHSIDERLLDQAGQQVDGRLTGRHGTDRLHRFEGKISRENRQFSEERLLARSKQVIAPVDGRAESLMAWYRRPTSTFEKVETVVQTIDDLFNPQSACADCRELDCKWHPVEPAAELDDGGLIVSRKRELAVAAAALSQKRAIDSNWLSCSIDAVASTTGIASGDTG